MTNPTQDLPKQQVFDLALELASILYPAWKEEQALTAAKKVKHGIGKGLTSTKDIKQIQKAVDVFIEDIKCALKCEAEGNTKGAYTEMEKAQAAASHIVMMLDAQKRRLKATKEET